MKLENTNRMDDKAKKIQYVFGSALPSAKGLLLVRGLRRSNFVSTIRLNVIAALLAPTMQTRIQFKALTSGKPSAAMKALIIAKGRANRV